MEILNAKPLQKLKVLVSVIIQIFHGGNRPNTSAHILERGTSHSKAQNTVQNKKVAVYHKCVPFCSLLKDERNTLISAR